MKFTYKSAHIDVTPAATAIGFKARAKMNRELSEGEDAGDPKYERDLGSFAHLHRSCRIRSQMGYRLLRRERVLIGVTQFCRTYSLPDRHPVNVFDTVERRCHSGEPLREALVRIYGSADRRALRHGLLRDPRTIKGAFETRRAGSGNRPFLCQQETMSSPRNSIAHIHVVPCTGPR